MIHFVEFINKRVREDVDLNENQEAKNKAPKILTKLNYCTVLGTHFYNP